MRTFTRIKCMLIIAFLAFCACNLSAQIGGELRMPSKYITIKTNIYMMVDDEGQPFYEDAFDAEIKIDVANNNITLKGIKSGDVHIYKYTSTKSDSKHVYYILKNGDTIARTIKNNVVAYHHSDGDIEIYARYDD